MWGRGRRGRENQKRGWITGARGDEPKTHYYACILNHATISPWNGGRGEGGKKKKKKKARDFGLVPTLLLSSCCTLPSGHADVGFAARAARAPLR